MDHKGLQSSDRHPLGSKALFELLFDLRQSRLAIEPTQNLELFFAELKVLQRERIFHDPYLTGPQALRIKLQIAAQAEWQMVFSRRARQRLVGFIFAHVRQPASGS